MRIPCLPEWLQCVCTSPCLFLVRTAIFAFSSQPPAQHGQPICRVGLKGNLPGKHHQCCFVRNYLLEMHIVHHHSTLESGTWGGPNNLCVNKPSRSFMLVMVLEVRITALMFFLPRLACSLQRMANGSISLHTDVA